MEAGEGQASQTVAGASDKPKVFISYSRVDIAFADRLFTLFGERGLEPYLDREDIAPGEPWQSRLGNLIAGADAIVLIVSPDSIRSPVVTWEVNEAERLNKRLLPIVLREVPGEAVPERVRRLNYIFFTSETAFAPSFEKLVQAILVDIAWVRESTRLLGLARRWEEQGRPESNLLAGTDIGAAEEWLMRAPLTASAPPGLVKSFITASRERQEGAVAGKVHALAKSAEEANGAGQHTLAVLLALEALAAAEESGRPLATAPAQRALYEARRCGRELNIVYALRAGGDEYESISASFAADGKRGLAYSWGVAGAALWDSESGLHVAMLQGSDETVEDALFSPNGKRVLTVEGRIAHVWNAASGQALGSLKPQSGLPIKRAAFSPDGSMLAAACFRGLYLFDAGTLTERLAIEAGSSHITNFVFSPGGKEIWTRLTREDFHSGVSEIPPIVAWNTSDGREILRFTGDAKDNNKLPVFTPDGVRVLARSDDGRCSIWDPRKDKRLAAVSEDASPYNLARCALSSDGSLLAAAMGTFVQLWHVASGRAIARLTGGDPSPEQLRFDVNAGRLIATSRAGTVQIWNTNPPGLFGKKERAPDLILEGHGGPVTSVEFSGDGQTVLTASADGTARLWSASNGAKRASFIGHSAMISKAFLTPDARRVLTVSADNTARLWDAGPNEAASLLSGRGEAFRTADFSAKARLGITVSADGTLRLWNSATGTLEAAQSGVSADFPFSGRQCDPSPADRQMLAFSDALQKHGKSRLEGAALSPDGRFILTVHSNFTCGLWQPGPLKPLRRLEDHLAPISAFCFADGAAMFATGALDAAVCIYDLKTGTLTARLKQGAPVAGLKLSADGRRLLVQSRDGSFALWDTASRQPELTVASSGLLAGDLRADGSFLAVAREGARVLVCDGERVVEIPDEEGSVLGAAISPDLQLVAFRNNSGAIRVVEAASGQELARLQGTDLHPKTFFCGASGFLAISGWRSLALFDYAGREVLRLAMRSGSINRVSMNAAGTHLLVCFEDGGHELWTFPGGEHIASFPSASLTAEGTPAAIFAPGGDWIISKTPEGCQLWRYFGSQTALVEAMRTAVPRALTPSERQRFLLDAKPPTWVMSQKKWPYTTMEPVR